MNSVIYNQKTCKTGICFQKSKVLINTSK